MNNDLISRSALLDQECFMDDDNGFRCSVVLSADVRRASAADARPQWISVKDRLPEHGDEVLVVLEVYSLFGKTNTCIATAIFTPPKWWAIADYDTGFVTATDETDVEVNRHRITHWMPLPEPPEEVPHG